MLARDGMSLDLANAKYVLQHRSCCAGLHVSIPIHYFAILSAHCRGFSMFKTAAILWPKLNGGSYGCGKITDLLHKQDMKRYVLLKNKTIIGSQAVKPVFDARHGLRR